jgi:hypothetical protein
MPRPRPLIGLILLALVLGYAAMLWFGPLIQRWIVSHDWTYPEEYGFGDLRFTPIGSLKYLVWPVFFSEVSLAAIWLALGRTSAPLRFAAVFFILIGWSAAIFRITNDSSDFAFGLLFTGIMTGAVAVPLLVARLFGLRLVYWEDGAAHEFASLGLDRLQFSLLFLFALMTVLALFLGMLQYVFFGDQPWLSRAWSGISRSWEWPLCMAVHTLLAWIALWAALGVRLARTRWRHLCSRLIVVGLTITAVCIANWCRLEWPFRYIDWLRAIGLKSLRTGDDLLGASTCGCAAFLLLLLLEFLFLSCSLGVFRLAGYRVVFGRRTEPAKA